MQSENVAIFIYLFILKHGGVQLYKICCLLVMFDSLLIFLCLEGTIILQKCLP